MKTQAQDKPQVYTIDCLKWRTGWNSENKTGKGETLLQNEEGYSCCLGFVCQQQNEVEFDLSKFNKQVSDPCDLYEGEYWEERSLKESNSTIIPLLNEVRESRCSFGKTVLKNTEFSKRAIRINDNEKTDVFEKIKDLRQLGREYNVKFVFKNLNQLSNQMSK